MKTVQTYLITDQLHIALHVVVIGHRNSVSQIDKDHKVQKSWPSQLRRTKLPQQTAVVDEIARRDCSPSPFVTVHCDTRGVTLFFISGSDLYCSQNCVELEIMTRLPSVDAFVNEQKLCKIVVMHKVIALQPRFAKHVCTHRDCILLNICHEVCPSYCVTNGWTLFLSYWTFSALIVPATNLDFFITGCFAMCTFLFLSSLFLRFLL